ncbi:MAG TPA: transcriptional regulator [Synergistaceae bacterium]|nr:transcriptional regulator [Synergistaceae bacterium]
MHDLVELFKALADETRLRILNLLYERELCVCDVMAVLDIPQSKASRHLIALKRVGLATDRREAQWMYYSLVREKETRLIEECVVGRLRGDDRYIRDLRLLDDMLNEKECPCGRNAP